MCSASKLSCIIASNQHKADSNNVRYQLAKKSANNQKGTAAKFWFLQKCKPVT